jgi:hypothetical protein
MDLKGMKSLYDAIDVIGVSGGSTTGCRNCVSVLNITWISHAAVLLRC